MKAAKRILDGLITSSLFLSILIFVTKTQLIIPEVILLNTDVTFSIAGTLIEIMTGALASVLGILMAIYLLAGQLIGRRPYSRLVQSFYDKTDFYYFGILFLALVLPVATYASWVYIDQAKIYYLLDICLVLYVASVLSLASIMLKHLGIFNAKTVAERLLRDFNVRNVLSYGLVETQVSTHEERITYGIKTWGHHHNLLDPLGSFHDILMEAINAKERITFHLYLSALIEKIASLDGVRFERKFGLAKGKTHHSILSILRSKLPILFYTINLEHRIQITVHALHYLACFRHPNMLWYIGVDATAYRVEHVGEKPAGLHFVV